MTIKNKYTQYCIVLDIQYATILKSVIIIIIQYGIYLDGLRMLRSKNKCIITGILSCTK